jgi:hypothetical protein
VGFHSNVTALSWEDKIEAGGCVADCPDRGQDLEQTLSVLVRDVYGGL